LLPSLYEKIFSYFLFLAANDVLRCWAREISSGQHKEEKSWEFEEKLKSAENAEVKNLRNCATIDVRGV
jgi:hypothetical protein